MGVAVKRLRIGRRRTQATPSSPLELALAPALVDGSWRVPERFNLTGDFVEVLGRDPKRPALTILGLDGIIEPRTFRQLSDSAARWAHILRSKGIEAGDRVLVLSRLNEDWIDIALGCAKVGAIFAPAHPAISPQALESRVAVTDAALVVAGEESEDAIARMSFTPEVHHVRSGRMRRASDIPPDEPTQGTSSRDVAFLAWTAGTEGDPKPVAHTHGSLFAARATAGRWLDPERGDLVWCATGPGSALTLMTIAGAWAHGAEVVLHEGDFVPDERLDLVRRIGPAVLCQSPAEYRALATLRQLARYRPPQLRRLLSTGDYLEPEVVETFRERWGLEIESAYGQTETGIVSATRRDEEHERQPGEIGEALPGLHLAVVDENGGELPPGVEGVLAVRGRPPTLFAGYWDSPEETKRAFRGDWYLTGDVAVAIRPGVFRYLARSGELITARGRTFGPHEVERALVEHPAVSACAVVGVRDLERGGQFVRAFVVLESGSEGSEQLEAELRQFAAQSLSEQQVPREIEFVDSLPRSPNGVLRRLELRDRPVSGRPLWEAPPTSEIESEPPTTVGLVASAEPTYLVRPGGLGDDAPTASAEPELQAAEPVADLVDAASRAPVVETEQEQPTTTVVPPPPEASAPHDAIVAEAALAPPAGDRHEPSQTASPPAQQSPTPALEPLAEEPTPRASGEPALEPQGPPTPEAHADPLGQQPPAASSSPVEAPPVLTPSPASAESAPEALEEPRDSTGAISALEQRPAVEETLAAGPEESTRTAPVPTPEPEPLPDYIVSPADAYAKALPLEVVQPPEPATEEPLPEYIVDPDRRPEAVAEEPPDTRATVPPAPRAPLAEHPLAGLARPQVEIPIADDSGVEPKPQRRRARSRSRAEPAPKPPKKRGRSEGEPGDEGLETGWMQRLSSRLNAYGMSERGAGKEEGATTEPADEPGDDATTST